MECRSFVESTVLGRCARCTSVQTSQEADWTLYATLGRTFRRHDGRILRLLVSPDDRLGTSTRRWDVSALESTPSGEPYSCVVGTRHRMTDAVDLADHFAVQWLESAPGTSVATYVQRPKNS